MAQIHRIGFTRLDDGEGREEQQECNIIFIHGLRGHPQRTWGGEGTGEIASSSRSPLRASFNRLSLKKRPSGADSKPGEHQVFWPRELLPNDLPRARIWTYGYNADVIDGLFRANNKNSVSQHGRDLVVRLERELDDQKPVIFVAHSLGGIIVKDAMCRSEALQTRTTGIIFLGTPHRGSSSADWAQTASNLARFALQDLNMTLTAALQLDSEVLSDIHEKFIKIVTRRATRIHSFQEARGMLGVEKFSGKVVSDFSSSLGLPDEQVETIDANHRQMVRCTGRDDARYRAIFGVLKQFLQTGQRPQTTVLQSLTLKPDSINSHFLVQFPKNKSFVGRTMVLNGLQEMLFNSEGPQNIAIVGLGGVGKTQVALQIAYWTRENKPGCSVFWLPALSTAGFEQACRAMARELEIQGAVEDDPKELVLQFLNSPRSGSWLLIIDNADDGNALLGTDTKAGMLRHLPSNDHGRILLTTRFKDVASAITNDENMIELEEMSEREARDFFQTLVSKEELEDDKAITALLEWLEYLPLAVSQAAAYIKRNKTPVSAYLSLLQDRGKRTQLLNREQPDRMRYRESRNAVATTWLVSFEHIREIDRPAADLLCFMSQIEPRTIPQTMLPQLGTGEELTHAIGTLTAFAFLQRRNDGHTFDMHRLVHVASQTWVKELDDGDRIYHAALAHFQETFSRYGAWKNREIWQHYLPHVLSLLQRKSEQTSWVSAECDLTHWAALCLEAEGHIDDAVSLLGQMVASLEKSHLEIGSGLLVSAYSMLGRLYSRTGKSKEAAELLEFVRAQGSTMATENARRLEWQLEQAPEHQNAEDDRYAVELLEDSRRHNTSLRDIASRVHANFSLAMAYSDLGKNKEAIELLERAVDETSALPETDSSRLQSQYDLASMYALNNQVERAIELLESVIHVQSTVLAENHPSRLQSQLQLAMIFGANGQVKKAIDILEPVVAVTSTTLRENHPDRLDSQHELAVAYVADGQVKRAIKLLEHVVLTSTALSESHPNRIESQHELARAYAADGQVERAIDLMEDVVKKRTDILVLDHPDRCKSEELLRNLRSLDCRGPVPDPS